MTFSFSFDLANYNSFEWIEMKMGSVSAASYVYSSSRKKTRIFTSKSPLRGSRFFHKKRIFCHANATPQNSGKMSTKKNHSIYNPNNQFHLQQLSTAISSFICDWFVIIAILGNIKWLYSFRCIQIAVDQLLSSSSWKIFATLINSIISCSNCFGV